MSSRRGVWLFVIALFLVGGGVLVAAFAVRGDRSQPVSTRTVLVWDVPDELSEGEPPHRLLGLGWLRRTRPAMFDVIRVLDRAAHDDRVRALVLHVQDLDWGWGRLSEVRDAVARVAAAGKPVYAVLESGGDAEYFLASVARVVAIPPATTLGVDGLSASATFIRGTLDKLDIHPNFAHAGEYKSGIEFYTRGDMSAPAREALEALLDDTFRVLVDSLARSRRLPRDSLLRLIDEGPFTASEAQRAGLVDRLAYADQVDSMAVLQAGPGAEAVTLAHYDDRSPVHWGARVAYVSASGTIASGRSRFQPDGGQVLGAETLIQALHEVRERHAIKAVVLRIDSPGGEESAADDIWHEVKRLAATKPVIVSMSDLAASGGYYIAAPASRIVAQPATITGSIGVYAGKLNILGLYRKLGLNVETVSRGRHAGLLSPFRDFTPEESARFQAQLEDAYRLFLGRVAEGRRLPEAAVDSVARGRVWSGHAARPCALVDSLGGILTAFHLAVRRAGLPMDTPFEMDVYPRVERTLFERLFRDWFQDEPDDMDTRLALLPPVARAWIVAAAFPAGRPLALLPWSISVR